MRRLFLLTLKPVIYVANVLEDGFEGNLTSTQLRAVDQPKRRSGAGVAAIEEELSQIDDADRDAFLADLGSTGRA